MSCVSEELPTITVGNVASAGLPPELLDLVLQFLVGSKIWRCQERRCFASFRAVCTGWNRVALGNPGLCSGFEISLLGFIGRNKEAIENMLSPWLSIASQPYSMRLLGTSVGRLGPCPEKEIAEITYSILNNHPSPTSLSIASRPAFSALLTPVTNVNLNITHLEVDTLPSFDDDEENLSRLPDVFPNLQSLIIGIPIPLDTKFSHGSLQSLALYDMIAEPDNFAHFLQGLPVLRELKVGCVYTYDLMMANASWQAIKLPSIEVLVVHAEDTAAEVLDHITLPSLQFFGLDTREKQGGVIDVTPFSNFFIRSALANITVSIMGTPSLRLLSSLLEILPSSTRLHANFSAPRPSPPASQRPPVGPPVSELFCPSLDWLEQWAMLRPTTYGTKIILPAIPNDGTHAWKAGVFRGTELKRLGYRVELSSKRAMSQMIRSRVPWMSVEWDDWKDPF